VRSPVRYRKLLVASAAALVALIAWAGPAAAQEEEEPEPELEHAEEECIELLEDGGTIEDCQEAPSLILPETNEIIWGALSFAVLFFLLRRFAWPGIKQSMEARSERIRSDLEAAQTQHSEAEQVLADYKAQLADAKAEAGRIIEEARQVGDSMKREQEARLQTDLAEMRTRSAADIETAKTQAIADLRGEVAKLAVGAAEVVVQKNLDEATQVELIENYINQVARQSS
jgi:F-type H+-transporting ATPase subunit b